MTDDRQLLARYCSNGSEEAFADLVRRYTGLVYSAALRQVGNSDLARDVAQMVFIHLAGKARSIPPETVLAGWLHRDARFTALDLLRAETRRSRREHLALSMNTPGSDPSGWDSIRPLLDEALDDLAPADRDALLLRFFEERDFAGVGAALGASAEAARKRVERALERLREAFSKRGITTTSGALGAVLSAHALEPLPAGLASSLASGALAGAAGGGGTALGVLILKLMAMTKFKLGVLGAILIGGLGTGLLMQHQSLALLRDGNESLQRQVEELRLARDRLAQSAADTNELARLRRNEAELLRLRGEVTVLRRDAQAPARSAAAGARRQTAPGGAGEASSGVTRFEGQVRARVGSGQTLITGGWPSGPGKHIFVMAVPVVSGETANQVEISASFVEVPEAALAEVGLEGLKVAGGETSLKQQVLPAEEAGTFWKALLQNDGVNVLSQPRVITGDGAAASISTSQPEVIDGATQAIGQSVTLTPVISSDKTSVDLTLKAAVSQAAKRP